jgi:quinol monooxygenase YgiN
MSTYKVTRRGAIAASAIAFASLAAGTAANADLVTASSDGVSYVVQMTIQDGGLETFKELARGFIASVEANEADTLTYQWWLDEDSSVALLYENFTDSDALLTHLGNVGPSLGALLEVAPITRFEAFGELSEAAREAIAPFGTVHFSHFGGFNR